MSSHMGRILNLKPIFSLNDLVIFSHPIALKALPSRFPFTFSSRARSRNNFLLDVALFAFVLSDLPSPLPPPFSFPFDITFGAITTVRIEIYGINRAIGRGGLTRDNLRCNLKEPTWPSYLRKYLLTIPLVVGLLQLLISWSVEYGRTRTESRTAIKPMKSNIKETLVKHQMSTRSHKITESTR